MRLLLSFVLVRNIWVMYDFHKKASPDKIFSKTVTLAPEYLRYNELL